MLVLNGILLQFYAVKISRLLLNLHCGMGHQGPNFSVRSVAVKSCSLKLKQDF
ncbi:hypothetical protein OIU76_009510 [Salix suchowensis]|uniref:Uncharacterized protein n=1 Tax=Salix suchowensis TaxID=1278906 RepID=A0ABQ9BCQ5_9ROSI|nr:hypothetical protein OIU76_009510 [Salix suchowensis]KAJ6382043.1 hypothetical protein OIU77_030652 [Salix suchowensis]